jgi:hypothetical protein
VLLVLVCVLSWPGVSLAQRDICGCAGNPNSLGAFDALDSTTYPPGTISGTRVLTIPLPEDGILIFDSFNVQPRPADIGFLPVRFARNAANTPVTLLVSGDVTIATSSEINVSGNSGSSGTSGVNGIGGLGGPGGFRGGDGAYQLVNFANDGGAGFGPGGGAPGTASPLTPGDGGTFLGVPELLPLLGGSGGGGGASTSGSLNCSSGGGGGGAGAILIAANGTITVNGTIRADGGSRGSRFNFSCSSFGGGGSGGAIRLVANMITGSGALSAFGGFPGGPGAIRLEAFINTMLATSTNPVAGRAPAPGPVSNPLTPTVAITAVNGQTQSLANGQLLSELPQGGFGAVDVILSVPGVATIDLATSGVPTGTTIKVTAKPRVGGAPVDVETTLDPANCDAEGNCVAAAAFDLAAGAFVIEAQATFTTP